MALITQYVGPFGGLNVTSPPVIIAPNEAAQCNNFMLRNNYISTRLKLDQVLPALPDGNPCVCIATGFDGLSKYYIYAMSNSSIYYLNGANAWTLVTGGGTLAGTVTPNYVNSLGSFIFVNGSSIIYAVTDTALNDLNVTFGAFYIMELAQTILICYTNEAGTIYPQRIRWCNTGNITQWDPLTYVGAGFVDLLDVSDVITGTLTMGSVGYVLRRNGITQVTPTGNGIQPWYFNHLWAAEHGIGQYYPNTSAQYGSLGFLLAEDNVYMFTPTSFEQIGEKVYSQIIQDISGATFYNPSPYIYAAAFPRRNYNYDYVVYELYMTNYDGGGGSIIWSYDVRGKRWTRSTTSTLVFTGRPNYVYSNQAGG